MRKYIILTITSIVLITMSNSVISQNNRDLFFVFLNTNPDKEVISEAESNKLQAAHLDNISNLNKEGKIIAAGPFDGGGGMFMLRAENIDQANKILSTDPAIAANRFKIEVFPFNIYNGNICGAEEPYEMVEYQFLRIKTNDNDSEALAKAMFDSRIHMAKLHNKTKELIIHGKFGNEKDGILILNVPDAETVDKIMKENESIEKGVITYETKTLWIAKGTFCE